MADHRTLLVLIAVLSQHALAQQANPGPLGVLITPPKRVAVPQDLRSTLPANAAVRLLQSTTLTADGEQIVVYEAGNKYEPNSHVAVLKNRRRVADFSLTKLFTHEKVADTYALFCASQFQTQDAASAFVAAFRNIGDGAGTAFVLIANADGRYRVFWKQLVTQGRLKVQRDGKIQVWNPTMDDGCVWCNHHYQVTTFECKNGRVSKRSHWTTKKALDPGAISDRPIMIANAAATSR